MHASLGLTTISCMEASSFKVFRIPGPIHVCIAGGREMSKFGAAWALSKRLDNHVVVLNGRDPNNYIYIKSFRESVKIGPLAS